MRLWHYRLFPYLPDLQFRGQLRELVAIMHDLRDKGQTNHFGIGKSRIIDSEWQRLLDGYRAITGEEYRI